MRKEFKFNFGFRDKLSELAFEGAMLGFFLCALSVDIKNESWWWATLDVLIIVWSYATAKKLTKELRDETAAH